jgi:predicted nucleic acid-binding protein
MRISRDALRHLHKDGHELCVTPQVIGEFWNVCTRPIPVNGLGHDVAAADKLASRIETLFTLLPDSLETFRKWRALILQYEVQGAKVHDAHLVASAAAYGISSIITFNAADFRRYPNITVLEPGAAIVIIELLEGLFVSIQLQGSTRSRVLSFANNRSGQKLLCRNTFIAVMESAELWNGDNLSKLQRLSRERTLLIEAQVGSRFVVVAEIGRQRSLEMASV